MELNDIINAISMVGFPIVVGVFFLKRLAKQDERTAAQYDALANAVNNNTKVVQELCYLIKGSAEGEN